MELKSSREKLRQLARLIGKVQAALADAQQAEAQRLLHVISEEAAYLFGDDWPLFEQSEISPEGLTEVEREDSGLLDEEAGR